MLADGRLAYAELISDETSADAILYQIAVHLWGEVSGWILQPGENLQPALIGQRVQPDCDIHIENFI